ncbi:MAG: threonine--tRNA ligase [Candidatus Bathyarchaeota archaeon]|nr:threonine--tRNA ligase [Candidatus Bathyarchaeota archaeon]
MKKNNKDRELSNADHRFIGQQLDLFSIDEQVGTGLILWHPKGVIIRNQIRDYWEREHQKNGYQLVCTPHIARQKLWETSGHLDHYKQNMYRFTKDGESYVVKPMNCPFHIQIYKTKPRSYKELPIRYAEWGTVYRCERSGTLHGLMRVRGFTQDDAHIFCTPDQVEGEVQKLLGFAQQMLARFEFTEYTAHLSTRDPQQPQEYMGSERKWKTAQKALAEALKKRNMPYTEMLGEAVFYGPKIDLNIVDAADREWQCTTIQFDFNLPKRFKIQYIGADGREHEVVMIHRAMLGAIERFVAIIIEHCKGNLPVWLAPTQVVVLPLTNDQLSFAEKVHQELLNRAVRSELDGDTSTISYRIRQAELQKTPYMAICGKKEASLGKVSVRKHGAGNIGLMTVEELVHKLTNENN